MSALHQILGTFSPTAVARSSSDDVAICSELPVLWVTLCLPGIGDTKMTYMFQVAHQGAAPVRKFDLLCLQWLCFYCSLNESLICCDYINRWYSSL